MLNQTLKYLFGTFFGKANYLSSLRSVEILEEAKLSGMAIILSVVGISIVTLFNFATKYLFLSNQPEEFGGSIALSFPWIELASSLVVYSILLISLGLLFLLSAYIFGVRIDLTGGITALILTSPYFLLLYLTIGLFFLFAIYPLLLILVYPLPIFLILSWIRTIYRIGIFSMGLRPGRSAGFVFGFLVFVVLTALFSAFSIPFGVIFR